MAEILASFPVCVLKIDLQCCWKCPITVKKKLHKVVGVLSVSLDTIKGEVKVRGVMEPHDLETAIEEIGKRAEILTYEKEPMKAKKSKPEKQVKKTKNHSSSCDSDANAADESVNGEKNPLPPNHGTGNHNACRCGPNSGRPPGCPRPAPAPTPLNSWCPITYCPSPQYLYSRRQKIPLTDPYAMCSGQTDAPVGNSGFHKFSDDNVNSCNVM